MAVVGPIWPVATTIIIIMIVPARALYYRAYKGNGYFLQSNDGETPRKHPLVPCLSPRKPKERKRRRSSSPFFRFLRGWRSSFCPPPNVRVFLLWAGTSSLLLPAIVLYDLLPGFFVIVVSARKRIVYRRDKRKPNRSINGMFWFNEKVNKGGKTINQCTNSFYDNWEKNFWVFSLL